MPPSMVAIGSRSLIMSEFFEKPILNSPYAYPDLRGIRQPSSTNFKVAGEQWQRGYEMRGQG